RILTETITSPTLHFQIQQLRDRFPQARWHQFEPVNRDRVREGSRMAFGEIVETHFHFDKAKTVLSLESDFLYSHPNSLRYTHDFAGARRAGFPRTGMNRLYVIESSPTVTGSNADHRLPLRSLEVGPFVFALAQKIGAVSSSGPGTPDSALEKWASA